MPGSRGAAVPHAAITWKLRIRWKLRTHISCFISAGRKVSTLTAVQAPMAGLLSARGTQGHHASLKLTALATATRSYNDEKNYHDHEMPTGAAHSHIQAACGIPMTTRP